MCVYACVPKFPHVCVHVFVSVRAHVCPCVSAFAFVSLWTRVCVCVCSGPHASMNLHFRLRSKPANFRDKPRLELPPISLSTELPAWKLTLSPRFPGASARSLHPRPASRFHSLWRRAGGGADKGKRIALRWSPLSALRRPSDPRRGGATPQRRLLFVICCQLQWFLLLLLSLAVIGVWKIAIIMTMKEVYIL